MYPIHVPAFPVTGRSAATRADPAFRLTHRHKRSRLQRDVRTLAVPEEQAPVAVLLLHACYTVCRYACMLGDAGIKSRVTDAFHQQQCAFWRSVVVSSGRSRASESMPVHMRNLGGVKNARRWWKGGGGGRGAAPAG